MSKYSSWKLCKIFYAIILLSTQTRESLIFYEIKQNSVSWKFPLFLMFCRNKQPCDEGIFNLLNKYVLGTYCVPDTVLVNERDRQGLCNLGAHILGKAVEKKENKGIKTKKKARQ